MVNPKTGRIVSQDDWKRTQVRMPQEQYESIADFANEQDISLNSAMIDLMDRGLSTIYSVNPSNIKIINLDNGIKRIIHGKMANSFEIDFTQNLSDLKADVAMYLSYLRASPSLKNRLMFLNKNVDVHQGGHHIDIIDDGVGSLNWLIVEDHITQKYLDNCQSNKKPAD